MKKILYLIVPIMILFLTTSCGDFDLVRTKLSYDEEMMEINLGDEISIIPNCNKEDVEIIYEASNDIVEMDDLGNLKALKTGTVIVKAKTTKRNSVSASIVIVVNDRQTFTITYDVNGGKPLDNTKITYGKGEVVMLPTPTKDGYKFLGWYENDTLVTTLTGENHVLKAMWEKLVSYTISYNLDGGMFTVEAVTEFEENQKIALPKPKKEGYIFLGWYENGIEITELTNKNYNLTAKWFEINSDSLLYTITYNLNGGTLPIDAVTSFEDSKGINLPKPTRTGHKFLGWYENNNLVTSITNKSYSLIAKWEKLPVYSISYDLDGGTIKKVVESYTTEDVFAIEEAVKEGYTFIGWTSELNKEPVKTLEIKNQSKNLTLKANFKANTYQITFKANGGSSDVKVDVIFKDTIKLTTNNITNKGMKLVGWNTEVDGTGKTYLINQEFTYEVVGNIELYAVWTSLINLELTENEKITADLPIIVKGQKEFTIPVPETSEYKFFTGWYLGEEQITDEEGENLKSWEFDEEVTLTPKWEESITKNGIKYYYLGEYPQKRVTDKETIELLNKEVPDYRGYCELNGDYYAKIIYEENTTVYFSDGTKVIKGETYYFKVEKILWRLIDEKNNIVISEYVLDALPYYDSELERKKYDTILGFDLRIYPNDYSESNLNQFLNDTLVNRYDLEGSLPRVNYENEGLKSIAFGRQYKIGDYIEYTNRIDNSEASTLYPDNLYSVINTKGYFYPLSHKEFKETYAGKLSGGVAYATDYAIVKGVECQKTSLNTLKTAAYWLRSPYYKSSKEALYVGLNGIVSNVSVTNDKIGLRPACKKAK